jgi:two-component system cell cycle sensor histidine kinase/response regulator CckA
LAGVSQPGDAIRPFMSMREGDANPMVLVVDDEPLIRWALAEALGDAGYEVREAETGAATLEVLGTCGGPLVVVLDLNLPDVTDLTLLRHIVDRRPDVPILMMTARILPEMRADAHRLGAAAWVGKPFDVQNVVDSVADIWARRQAQPQQREDRSDVPAVPHRSGLAAG